MLTSFVIKLVPAAPVELPRELGRAAHSALLEQLLPRQNRALADELHQGSGLKPFTCSGVYGGKRRAGTLYANPEDVLWVRYTGLRKDVSGMLAALTKDLPDALELNGVKLTVGGATIDAANHYAAGTATYDSLAAPYLLSRNRVEPLIALKFISPTSIRAKDQNVPVPLPGSIFGSLCRRWNAFADMALPDETQNFAEQCVAISQYRCRTRMIPGKSEKVLIGFVGTVLFRVTNPDRYWLGIINLLSDYAWYAGVGYQTTQGMGQVRRITVEDALSAWRKPAASTDDAE